MKKNIEGLNSVFKELEHVSESEGLDKRLKDLGVDPNQLVTKGLAKIEALKQSLLNEQNEEEFDPFLMAAKRTDDEIED